MTISARISLKSFAGSIDRPRGAGAHRSILRHTLVIISEATENGCDIGFGLALSSSGLD